MTTIHPPLSSNCRIRGCTSAAVVYVTFGEWVNIGADLCERHRPTAEQALRRGIVAKLWTVDGYYPNEIARMIATMTGHVTRESTVTADLKWLGLTEQHRAAEERLKIAVNLGEAGPNVVALRRPS